MLKTDFSGVVLLSEPQAVRLILLDRCANKRALINVRLLMPTESAKP